MNRKKLLAGLLVVLSVAVTGCGAQKEEASGEKQVVKLGVVGSVYDELWAPAKKQLESEGIDLQLVQFSDYATPNNALNSGEIDLNGFQHEIYLKSEIESYGYDIQTIGYTFISPLNIYSDKIASIDEIKAGDTVAIPNDATNGGRALKILEAAGLIKLKDDISESPSKEDIESYTVDFEIKELAANTIPSALPDITAGVINGNYALDFGLKTEEAIFKDTLWDDESYWNLVAARTSDLEDPAKVQTYKKVVEAFQTDETQKVFDETYGGYYISVGWDQNLLEK